MKLRPSQESDLPELVDLFNEAYEGSHEFIPYTEEKLRAELEGANSVLLVVDEHDRISGLALLRREWYGEEVVICARPGQTRQKIEEQLLLAIEPQAQTGRVTVLVNAEDQERIGFFTARGYQSESSLYQLIAELDRPRPMPPVPEGCLLRSLKPDEEEALIQVVNTAFQGERLQPGALARWRSQDPAFCEEWVQVAEHGGQLVAAVVARSDRELNLHYHAKRGYLGPAATLPAHRGKGLGKALTRRAMNFLGKQGMQTVYLHTWEGNTAVLSLTKSLGFRVGHQWKILVKSVRAPL
jgi:ribosomal protein S18 acetylase RimI-like enzyme